MSRSEANGLASGGLGWMLLRASPVRLGAIFVTCAIALVVALAIIVQSLQQSGPQLAARETGAADYSLRLDGGAVAIGSSGASENRELTSAMHQAGATDAEVGYFIYGLTPDDHHLGEVTLYEREWLDIPFPDRYILVAGEWPTRPGQIAVSDAFGENVAVGDEIDFFGGALSTSVVGVVRDDFARSSSFGLTAPGTWDSIGGVDSVAAARFGVTATREFFWNTPGSAGAVVEAVKSISTARLGLSPDVAETLAASVVSKEALSEFRPAPPVELAAVALVGPFAAALFSGWFAVRFMNRIRETLRRVGVYRTGWSGVAALAIATSIGVTLGCLFGTGVGFAARSILDFSSDATLGPIRDLGLILIAVLASAVAGAALSLVLLRRSKSVRAGDRKSWWQSVAEYIPVSVVVPLLIVVLVVSGVVLTQASTVNEQFISLYFFGMATVLLAPYVLRVLLRLKVRALAVSLAFRRADADFRLTAIAMIALSAVLMVSFSLSTVYFSSTSSANARTESDTPPGQIHFEPRLESEAQSDALRAEVERYLGIDGAVRFSRAVGAASIRDGATLIFDDAADLERVIEVPLSSAQRLSLAEGGSLRSKAPNLREIVFEKPDGESFPLPATTIEDIDPSFRAYDGFILASTAAQHGIASIAPAWAYPDVTAAQISLTREAPQAIGFEGRWLQIYEPPDVLVEPLEFRIIAVAIAVLGGTIMGYYAAASSRALRPNLAALRALGMTRRWLVAVVGFQVGTVLVVAVAVAVIAAVVATLAAIQLWMQGTSLYVPWESLSLLIGLMAAFVLASVFFSTRKLATSERLDSP